MKNKFIDQLNKCLEDSYLGAKIQSHPDSKLNQDTDGFTNIGLPKFVTDFINEFVGITIKESKILDDKRGYINLENVGQIGYIVIESTSQEITIEPNLATESPPTLAYLIIKLTDDEAKFLRYILTIDITPNNQQIDMSLLPEIYDFPNLLYKIEILRKHINDFSKDIQQLFTEEPLLITQLEQIHRTTLSDERPTKTIKLLSKNQPDSSTGSTRSKLVNAVGTKSKSNGELELKSEHYWEVELWEKLKGLWGEGGYDIDEKDDDLSKYIDSFKLEQAQEPEPAAKPASHIEYIIVKSGATEINIPLERDNVIAYLVIQVIGTESTILGYIPSIDIPAENDRIGLSVLRPDFAGFLAKIEQGKEVISQSPTPIQELLSDPNWLNILERIHREQEPYERPAKTLELLKNNNNQEDLERTCKRMFKHDDEQKNEENLLSMIFDLWEQLEEKWGESGEPPTRKIVLTDKQTKSKETKSGANLKNTKAVKTKTNSKQNRRKGESQTKVLCASY